MEWLSWVRDAYRVMPYVRTTYQRAACVIAGSQYTLQTLPESARRRAVYIPENGVDPTVFYVGQRTPPSTITPFRIVFAGRLVPYKGADMLLEAVATSERLRSTSQIIIAGAGPQRGYLTKLANSVGIDDRVRIEGHMRQPQLRQLYCESSVFAFPSLREFGGAVVLEAMACGLPCVVLDYGGPGEHVTPETGVRLPLGSRGEIVAALRAALEMLHSQPDVLDIMSHNAIQRVANSYTWAVKARQICDQYHRVLQWPPVDPKHVPHGI